AGERAAPQPGPRPPVRKVPAMTVVEIRTSSERDPDGAHFRALLRAIDQVNRLGAIRSVAVHALAGLGVVLWASMVFSGVPELVRNLAILTFSGTALWTLVTLALESHWQRIQRKCMKETDARVLDGDRRDERQRR